jgi:hypothetical protein
VDDQLSVVYSVSCNRWFDRFRIRFRHNKENINHSDLFFEAISKKSLRSMVLGNKNVMPRAPLKRLSLSFGVEKAALFGVSAKGHHCDNWRWK